jgi:hypothetical protein
VLYHRGVTHAFYLPDGDGFVATEHTRGPWSPKHQHGGPPAALIAHVAEAMAPELVIARMTVDFLRPVPIDRLGVRVETLRAGSKVQRLVGSWRWATSGAVASRSGCASACRCCRTRRRRRWSGCSWPPIPAAG